MNSAQIHLALNHIPLFLAITGCGILLLGYFQRNESFITLSLWLLLAAGLSVIPVYLTGQATEEIAEHLPGVNDTSIEEHENMARISLIITAIAGLLALGGLVFRKQAWGKYLLIAVIVASLTAFGIMAQTAHLGGLIRHTELGGATVSVTGDEKENESGKNKRRNRKEEEAD